MNAVDTNLLVRYLVQDDREQARRTERIIEGESFLIATTVLLETEWVLRDVYGYSPTQVGEALRALIALPTVVLQSPETAVLALESMSQGWTSRRAPPCQRATNCETFYTFDKALVRRSKRQNRIRVAAP